MGFTRQWDDTCPRVWDKWGEDGVIWMIQDLAPEDYEEAIEILVEHLVPDERLCSISNVGGDLLSLRSITQFWRDSLAQKMSLGCYTLINGEKSLIGLNVLTVDTIDETVPDTPIEGAAWTNVYRAMEYLEHKYDPFKYLNLGMLLHALGLVVKREYRGKRLGSRILEARRQLSLAHGIEATATMFTGPASQNSAATAGFETIGVVSLKELAENGMDYPLNEDMVIKLMVKRFD